MISLDDIRDSVTGITARLEEYQTALQWTIGPMSEVPTHLLPAPEGDAGRQALARLTKMASSQGPRVFQHIRDGVLGNINWGGDDDELDEVLEEVDLTVAAERLFERGCVGGLIVGIVSQVGGEWGIRRLGGYVEPITDPFDYDVVRGFAQVVKERVGRSGNIRYTLHVYDMSVPEATVRLTWSRISSPDNIGDVYDETPVPYPPRFAVLQVGADGLPVGDMQRALPILQSEWASQVRSDRVEEATGFPQAVVKGEVLHGVDKRGPTNIIELSADGDYAYVLPGDLSQIHAHHDRKLERLRDETRLPGGSLGTQTPSGEALREAAVKFFQMCSRYADNLSTVLTDLGHDLSDAVGVFTEAAISVGISREAGRDVYVDMIIKLHKDGLLEFGAAVRAVSVYVPTWESAEVEEFIRRELAYLTADEERAALESSDPVPSDEILMGDGTAPTDGSGAAPATAATAAGMI